jgi:serine/threonine protein phosphatase PrpC
MDIVLHKSFSVSETETGIKNIDIIYPAHDSMENENRLFITCGGNSNKSLIAGQIACEAIKTYFYSFLESNKDISVDFIEKAIRMGEISLSEYQKNNPVSEGLYTVLSLFYLAADCIYLCQIGESRIYQIRESRIIHKSIDSSSTRKIQGIHKPAEINVVILKDIQPNDQFFISNCNLLNSQDEKIIYDILMTYTSPEEKLSQIKTYYLNKYKKTFSAHLIPIRDVRKTKTFKQRMNSLLYSFV